MSYTLINVEQRASKTFKIPSKRDRHSLRQGDKVKLIFDDRERLWVEVDQRSRDTYSGFLRNHPINPDFGNFGDEVTFCPEHVCEIFKYQERGMTPVGSNSVRAPNHYWGGYGRWQPWWGNYVRRMGSATPMV